MGSTPIMSPALGEQTRQKHKFPQRITAGISCRHNIVEMYHIGNVETRVQFSVTALLMPHPPRVGCDLSPSQADCQLVRRWGGDCIIQSKVTSMDLPYLEYWHWDNDRPDLSQFPAGRYALMLGSLFSGYKFKGTFDTVALAVEWLDKRPLLGKVSIIPVQDPDTFTIHVGSNPSTSEPDEMDAAYPPGDYMVITRNVFHGIRFWGYFSTLRSAVEWIEARQPEIGNTSVVQVEDASLIPSQVEDDPEITE